MTAPRLPCRVCNAFSRGAWRMVGFVAGLFGALGAVDAQVISQAKYGEPTSEYPHAVLGDALEWKNLQISVSRGIGDDGVLLQASSTLIYNLRAPDNMVYEDIAPRLWDVTGDGNPEVVVVQSHQNLGARLLIIGLNDAGKPVAIAGTGHIGTRFRWLAPVGAADFDSDGHIEIAFVDRPHLAKTLQVWRYTDTSFEPVAQLRGVSNHRIGEDFISGGVRDCGAGPEMILADANWRNIMAIRMAQTDISGTRIAPFSGSFEDALNCGEN